MNERGDDHLSFYAAALAVSPCGRYLLAATEGPRVLVLRVGAWRVVRTLFLPEPPQFHRPTVAWAGSARHAYASVGGDIHLLHIGSARPLRKLAAAGRTAGGGAASVRDLHWDAARRLLASCSFDKTVRLWSEAAAPS
jgi:hypothetical protein